MSVVDENVMNAALVAQMLKEMDEASENDSSDLECIPDGLGSDADVLSAVRRAQEDDSLEGTKRSKTSKTTKSHGKTNKSTEECDFTYTGMKPIIDPIDELPEFVNLPKDMTVTVNFKEHDIPYKDQLWGIPRRTVEYIVELIKYQMGAARAAREFRGCKDDTDEKDAKTGKVRYYRVVSYLENLPFRDRYIAYIRVINKNNKIYASYCLTNDSRSSMDTNELEKSLNNIIERIQATKIGTER